MLLSDSVIERWAPFGHPALTIRAGASRSLMKSRRDVYESLRYKQQNTLERYPLFYY